LLWGSGNISVVTLMRCYINGCNELILYRLIIYAPSVTKGDEFAISENIILQYNTMSLALMRSKLA